MAVSEQTDGESGQVGCHLGSRRGDFFKRQSVQNLALKRRMCCNWLMAAVHMNI